MSLYISSKQLDRENAERPPVPLLLLSPDLGMQHRTFSEEFEFGKLLQDMFELNNTSGAEEPYFMLPSGCMMMIFYLSPRAASCILCGALTTMRRLRIPAGSLVFCVRFRPESSDWLVEQHGASLLADRAAPLTRYLHGTDQLLTGLRRSESFHERCVLITRMLSAREAGQYRPMAFLRRCMDLILDSCGLARVSEIAATVGCSDRYLNRVFQERVGISPKLYSEIIQMQFSLYSILTTQPKSLLDIAVNFGYFDQTHMNRLYRKLLDCTASDIRYADSSTIIADDIPAAL
ncbi:helix-turn-helix domain-containing protein [Oscillibacter sp.]|uniref:helix-turn-helix transcriptional regulator n=1 Tax=Oscillibacter sp. TaxID=1945593 RepID=UPI0033985484